MKKQFSLRGVAIACGISLAMAPFGRPAAAEEQGQSPPPATAPRAPISRDVTLGAGGRMEGVLLDRQGMPCPGMQVVLLQNEQEVASTTTDVAGRFAIVGLRGGQYNLATVDEVIPCRLWAEGTAPPSSKQTLQIYGGDLMRGQMFRARNFITSPITIGAAVGTAVAVPLALHNREPAS